MIKNQSHVILNTTLLDTPLGQMQAIANDVELCLLEFVEQSAFERNLLRLQTHTNSIIVPGHSAPLISIEQELKAYFTGDLQYFQTPLAFQGSDFQKLVWKSLLDIPYGHTLSYLNQARSISRPSACRAVANANAANAIAIVVPCHRVVQSNGKLGGYAGGEMRKQWLLAHESGRL
jgi:O-6-methylguanine DNA methyltransferase